MRSKQRLRRFRYASFNCAAPFRERLLVIAPPSLLKNWHLQLCRSLSGAVIDCRDRGCWRKMDPSIVPLPFGSGYRRDLRRLGPHHTAFNCAAPFRERL